MSGGESREEGVRGFELMVQRVSKGTDGDGVVGLRVTPGDLRVEEVRVLRRDRRLPDEE